MQDKEINIYLSFFILLIILNLESCYPVTAFSESAYSQSVRLKVESLELIGKAVENYSGYTAQVDSLKHNLRLAYEYAKGRPNNETIENQWKIMLDSDRNLIGGFLRIWKEDLKLSPQFVSEAQSVIGSAFDTIIGLESGKIKSTDLPDGQTVKSEEN